MGDNGIVVKGKGMKTGREGKGKERKHKERRGKEKKREKN